MLPLQILYMTHQEGHPRRDPIHSLVLASTPYGSQGWTHTSSPSRLRNNPSSSISHHIFPMSLVTGSRGFPDQCPPSSSTAPCSSWFRVGHQGSVITEEGTEAQHCHMSHRKQWQKRQRKAQSPKAAVPSEVTCRDGGPDHRCLLQARQ